MLPQTDIITFIQSKTKRGIEVPGFCVGVIYLFIQIGQSLGIIQVIAQSQMYCQGIGTGVRSSEIRIGIMH